MPRTVLNLSKHWKSWRPVFQTLEDRDGRRRFGEAGATSKDSRALITPARPNGVGRPHSSVLSHDAFLVVLFNHGWHG